MSFCPAPFLPRTSNVIEFSLSSSARPARLSRRTAATINQTVIHGPCRPAAGALPGNLFPTSVRPGTPSCRPAAGYYERDKYRTVFSDRNAASRTYIGDTEASVGHRTLSNGKYLFFFDPSAARIISVRRTRHTRRSVRTFVSFVSRVS